MDDLRRELLYCRDLLDSAMRRLPDLPQQSIPFAREAQEDTDGTPLGAD